jgi:predicted transcriptional regulator
MTIEIAVRTSSAVVFAADSKLTTSGLVGFEQDGKPRFVQQSYDNAVKLVSDQNRVLMAMVAGQVTLVSRL